MGKKRQRWQKVVGLAGALGITAFGFSTPVGHLAALPPKLIVPAGQDVAVPWSHWLPVAIRVSSLAKTAGQTGRVFAGRPEELDIRGQSPGQYLLHFRLFGWLPWKSLPVEVQKPLAVVPGGESVGVVVKTHGLVVTGLSPIPESGRTVDPAHDAGIDRGDVILMIDHRPAASDSTLAQAVERAGRHRQAISLLVKGARLTHIRRVRPVWSSQAHRYQIGIRVQDHASGVGTLTFYDPRTGGYAALGHSITDGLTRRPVAIAQGQILDANIVGVIAGTADSPGQKVGVLAGGENIDGTVTHNGRFGIVGRLRRPPPWGAGKTIPVAFPDQVKTGPASVVTVMKGQTPAVYRIEILRTSLQLHPQTKGLLFKVVDSRLLAKTGGVVQGMSGSPIIQDGRLVGAVTHVLVSQPTLGYGCYAYWMVRQKALNAHSLG